MNILIAVLIIFIILPSAIKSDFPPHLIPPVKAKKTISIPFQLTSLNQIITNVCLGTPPICYPFKIATNINECFIFDKSIYEAGYDITRSSSAYQVEDYVEFEHAFSKYEGIIVEDTLSIPDTSIVIENFNFFVVNKGETSSFYAGVLGMGKKYEDNEFSFLSMLYQTDFIDNQVFSLSYLPTDSKGIMKLGYHEITDKKIYKSVELIEDDDIPYFEIMMDGILYENELSGVDNYISTYTHSQVSLLSPGANNIYCPQEFFKFLIEKIFSDIIQPKIFCDFEKKEGNFRIIECDPAILDYNLGSIRFVFGKWNVIMSFKELFADCGNNSNLCFSIMSFDDNHKWIFGYPFLKRFPVLFDFDYFEIYLKTK